MTTKAKVSTVKVAPTTTAKHVYLTGMNEYNPKARDAKLYSQEAVNITFTERENKQSGTVYSVVGVDTDDYTNINVRYMNISGINNTIIEGFKMTTVWKSNEEESKSTVGYSCFTRDGDIVIILVNADDDGSITTFVPHSNFGLGFTFVPDSVEKFYYQIQNAVNAILTKNATERAFNKHTEF